MSRLSRGTASALAGVLELAGRSCGAFATATRNDPVLFDSENLQPQMRAPTPQNVTVRSPRPRDYLTEREVEKLIDAARDNRWGHREDPARLSPRTARQRVVALRWDDINLQQASCMRAASRAVDKRTSLGARKLRALRRLQRETPEGQRSVHVFVSERLAPFERGRLSTHGGPRPMCCRRGL